MAKIISATQAATMVEDGATVMIGGFGNTGTPQKLVGALAEKGSKNLTLISNDTGHPGVGIGRLIANRQVKKAIVSHIGTNPETGKQYNAQELELEFAPQGTLAERLRAGGVGLGGFLTPTGVGTVIAEGKDVITVDGKEFLLEKPLKADVALINAHKADEKGNLVFRLTAQNFNPMMAMAGNTVIAEVAEIVAAGEILPDEVMLPGIFVDYLVKR